MKMTKETWVQGQCQEVEACLRKNNNKKAYQLVKDLTTEKQGKTRTIQDNSGKCLTEENEILNRRREYYSNLYNYETEGDPIGRDCPQIPDAEHHPILREEVEAAVKALKMGKSAGVDNGGRLITNLRFADDIVVNAEEEEEAGVLVDRLDTTTTRYKMEIGPDKTKVMTNNPNGFQREIKIKGQRLEEVENFKYLGAIISNEGSKSEILSRIAQTTASLSKLKILWRDKNISFACKVKLMRTLILSTFLYACESWTLTAEIERRIQALEMRCFRRLLNISYQNHLTNEEVCNRIQNAIGGHDDPLTMVKKRKLRWYGHISRSSGMAKTILQGTVKGERRRRRQKRWEDNIKEWTGMGFGDSLRAAGDREGWKGIAATSSVVPRRPPRLRD